MRIDCSTLRTGLSISRIKTNKAEHITVSRQRAIDGGQLLAIVYYEVLRLARADVRKNAYDAGVDVIDGLKIVVFTQSFLCRAAAFAE